MVSYAKEPIAPAPTTQRHQLPAHPQRLPGPPGSPRRTRRARLTRLLACLLMTCNAPISSAAGLDQDWIPVDQATLDQARGGFIALSGLEVSLGIERLVTLNGTIISRTNLTIPDIGKLSIEQAKGAAQALSAISLVRAGSDDMAPPPAVDVAPAMHSVPGPTLIQNSLNGQHIDSRTVINSSVNTLGLLTSLNFQGSLGDAIARSARPF
jgi:hypothetical protein